MARISHQSEKSDSSNPATKFLEWRSNDKEFDYFDKALNESLLSEGKTKEDIKAGRLANVPVPLPFKFVFIQQYHTVKGWHSQHKSKIYSNEVFYIGNDPITVRAHKPKGTILATGIYKDIKPQVSAVGGKYHKSIYVMLEDGELVNISLKGAAVREWGDFFNLEKFKIDDVWVTVPEAVESKEGSINYSTPKFVLGEKLTNKQSASADSAAAVLKQHLDGYFKKEVKAEYAADVEAVETDSLPF